MKLKLQPHHIAEIAERPQSRQWETDVRALMEHIEAIEEELQYANAFLASLPPIQWRNIVEEA